MNGKERSAQPCCEHINCMKLAIPLSKLKGLQDEVDIPEIVEFRCDSWANCPTCKMSARSKTKSLQESFEQQVIEKSVHVDMVEAKVWVDLPFIKEPVEYLTKKHGGPNNYNQALKVYQGQCRKHDEVKDQVRKAYGELVEKCYMSQLSALPRDFHISRGILPEETVVVLKFRIIIVAGVPAKFCSFAIYARVEELNGNYSCSLILAKGKRIHGTIPKNELEGVVSLMVQ